MTSIASQDSSRQQNDVKVDTDKEGSCPSSDATLPVREEDVESYPLSSAESRLEQRHETSGTEPEVCPQQAAAAATAETSLPPSPDTSGYDTAAATPSPELQGEGLGAVTDVLQEGRLAATDCADLGASDDTSSHPPALSDNTEAGKPVTGDADDCGCREDSPSPLLSPSQTDDPSCQGKVSPACSSAAVRADVASESEGRSKDTEATAGGEGKVRETGGLDSDLLDVLMHSDDSGAGDEVSAACATLQHAAGRVREEEDAGDVGSDSEPGTLPPPAVPEAAETVQTLKTTSHTSPNTASTSGRPLQAAADPNPRDEPAVLDSSSLNFPARDSSEPQPLSTTTTTEETGEGADDAAEDTDDAAEDTDDAAEDTNERHSEAAASDIPTREVDSTLTSPPDVTESAHVVGQSEASDDEDRATEGAAAVDRAETAAGCSPETHESDAEHGQQPDPLDSLAGPEDASKDYVDAPRPEAGEEDSLSLSVESQETLSSSSAAPSLMSSSPAVTSTTMTAVASAETSAEDSSPPPLPKTAATDEDPPSSQSQAGDPLPPTDHSHSTSTTPTTDASLAPTSPPPPPTPAATDSSFAAASRSADPVSDQQLGATAGAAGSRDGTDPSITSDYSLLGACAAEEGEITSVREEARKGADPAGGADDFHVGSRAAIGVPSETLKELQFGFGGVTATMLRVRDGGVGWCGSCA